MEGDLSFANWYAVLDILVQKYVENNIEIIIKKNIQNMAVKTLLIIFWNWDLNM